MEVLLSELGSKLAERWLSLLVLPGVLYLAVVAAARELGHARPFDVARLADRIGEVAEHPATETVGGQVVILTAVLAAAAAVGIAARALGSLVERLWLAAEWRSWPRPLRALAARRVRARQRRWSAAHDAWRRLRAEAARARALGRRLPAAERRAARRAMERVAPEYPDRPTWSGDRVHAAAVRVARDQRLDLATVWPHLWLVLPEESRVQLTTARQDLGRATALAAWALLYLPVAAWWWPAALVGLGLAGTGWWRTRAAVAGYAALLEAAVRLHTLDLAQRLGLDVTGRLTAEQCLELNRLLETTPEPADEER
ncbi:hypothetical protein E1265_05560 [Streptomyces sp. 8K308]|uniref:hypothetical protein n=1 Tax=Streptomyces sp. 8K308 TaxID=2530388 RepID=UPI00104EFE30|nr:hypothetical protein [Streptomyces sp. 8K308]TDC25966.1 hypothetical protein E1265_05560 [Streptomyces sp. 8K308]